MDKKAILKALRDTAQATSNEIANTVAMPIDLINSGLGRIGLGSERPVGGSKWFADMGLTAPVEEGSAPQLAGETLGLVLPMAGALKAKEIAAALRKGGENLANSVPIPRGGQRGVLSMGDTLAAKVATEAPQAEALRLAQQRAALPVEQGGLGLPANNTAMDRARAMGFDVDAYHGTASTDIQKFMPEGGTPEGKKILEWYKNRQAQSEPVGYMSFRSGSFFSPKPEYAGHYAPKENGVIYPVKLKMDNPLSLLPNAQGRYSATNAPDINKTIDAMILQDSIDKSINEISIIDPAQIRSRFAAFDPWRRTAAVAAAMGVAAPNLLAAENQPAGRPIINALRQGAK